LIGLENAVAWGADWVWLLDDDAVPRPEALACLIGALPDLPEDTGGVGCAVREYGRLALRHRRRFFSLTGWEWSLGRRLYKRDHVEMDTASFVGFLVSAKAARQVDWPEAEFFMAYDDTDYSLHLRKAG
jgi:GT2 family glycosyltransferase